MTTATDVKAENAAYKKQLAEAAKKLRADAKLQAWDDEWLNRRGNYYTLITPEIAAQLLERNVNNRPAKRRAIGQYARDMQAGDWNPDASDLKFNVEGYLQDGQNRLMACIEAGTPFPTLVRTVLDPDARDHIDQGVRRTTSDSFRMAGVVDANNVAAAILMRERYERTVREYGGRQTANPRRIPMTHAEAIEYLAEHPTVEKMAGLGQAMHTVGPGVPKSVYIAGLSMFAESSEKMAREFGETFIDGSSSGTGDPMLALTRYLARAKSPGELKSRSRNRNQQHLGALVTVWNAYLQGEKLERLTMRDTDLLPMPV